MSARNIVHLPVGVNFHTPKPKPKKNESDASSRKAHVARPFTLPRWALVIDTETAAIATPTMPGFEDWKPEGQALLFGRMLVARWNGVQYVPDREFLFYPDDLPRQGIQRIRAGMRARISGDHYETDDPPHLPLFVEPLSEFMDHFYFWACRRRSYVVGFNLPFDLSRLAFDVTYATQGMVGGFSFALWRGEGGDAHPFRPRLRIRQLDNVKSFFKWSTHPGAKKDETGKLKRVGYQNLFIDVRTLLNALTGGKFTLDRASKKFLTMEMHKAEAGEHGIITSDYIAYNRQDVYATLGLLNYALAEWASLGISTPPHNLYSSAGVAKSYLKEMGVQPRLEVQPDFPDEVMGYAMNAYYGGRVETMLRKILAPVVHVDFMSMYPTVNALMGVWDYVIADRVEVFDDTNGVQTFLDGVTKETMFQPETWAALPALALVQPDGDVLPVRGNYGDTENIGINPYWGPPQWYTLPDLVASKLLRGKAPKVLRALRLVAVGQQSTLKPIQYRGVVPVDPAQDDFFRLVIEERRSVKQALKARRQGQSVTGRYADMSMDELDSLQLSLKLTANSGSYGVNVERNKVVTSRPQPYTIYSDREIEVARTWREEPGKYYFPPLAALITGAARLMLALLEREIKDRGGWYVTSDTDSAYIVADREAYDLPLEGRGNDGQPIAQTVHVLSWSDVQAIVDHFDRLNPYPSVPGSILQYEDDNYRDGQQRRIWCYSISSKRYCLLDDNGEVVDGMESSLADFILPDLLLDEIEAERQRRLRVGLNPDEPPITPTSVFIVWAWETLVHNRSMAFELWTNVKQVYSRSVSTWHVYEQFAAVNAGRSWRDRVKPFNFFVRAAYWEQEAILSGTDEVRRVIQASGRSLPAYEAARTLTPERLSGEDIPGPVAELLYDLFAYDDTGIPAFDPARITAAKVNLFYRLHILGKGHVRQTELDDARLRAGVLLAADEWTGGTSFNQRDRALLLQLADSDDERVVAGVDTIRDRRLRGKLAERERAAQRRGGQHELFVSVAGEEGAARLRENKGRRITPGRLNLPKQKPPVIRKTGQWISMFSAYERTGQWETLTWYRASDGSRIEPVDEMGFRTLGKTVRAYDDHPEHPYYGPDGKPCTPKTRGLMQRRPIAAIGCYYTGKQVPTLDVDWDHIEDANYDPRILYDGTGNEWAKGLPVLRDMGAVAVSAELQTTVDAVKKWLSGNNRPTQVGEAVKLAIAQAARLTGVNGFAALDAYLMARETLMQQERDLLTTLSPRDIAARYGVSVKQARRYENGTMPPFRNVVIAQARGRSGPR